MSDWIKATCACVTLLVGGAVWAMTNFVPAGQFEQHLENDERRYVLELKRSIRDIRKRLAETPDDPYLLEELEETIDTLCEIRPQDKLCQ